MNDKNHQNRTFEHFEDSILIYGVIFILTWITSTCFLVFKIPNFEQFKYALIGAIFIAIFFIFIVVRKIRKNNETKKRLAFLSALSEAEQDSIKNWIFLVSLSETEQKSVKDLFDIAKVKGFWSLPDLDEEIKNYFLKSKKVKIKVTRGYNLFFDDGINRARDIFYHCIFEAGKKDKREIELLLHLPCLQSPHTRQRAAANHMMVSEYIEKLFEVIKKLKEVTLSNENKNEITVKFYNDYEVKLGILRRVTMLFRGKRSMFLAGGRVQQMLFQRFKVSY